MHFQFCTNLYLNTRLDVERNARKFLSRGQVPNVYGILLKLHVQGHSDVIWCISEIILETLHLENGWSWDQNLGVDGKYSVYTGRY